MSLLTQEQIAKSEMIRETQFLRSELSKAAANDCQTLLDIIDDLQTRHSERKQYTAQDLEEMFKSYNFHPSFLRFDSFQQWLHCARALGALKAEP